MPNTLPRVVIATPYLAEANNGNWRTAHRWQSMLAGRFAAIVQKDWTAESAPGTDLMIALHARRSADLILRFKAAFPERPLVVVLTGTDLYRDLVESAAARQSLAIADALIVLQEDGIRHIPQDQRRKTHVVYQSARPLKPATKPRSKLDCVVVGHLREEKSPQTIFRLMESLPSALPIRLLHIGGGQDSKLAAQAVALAASHRNYQWSGALPHGLTRAAIKRAHLLIHPSIMEGGANVIVEAITAGTPVLASRMSGNIGMLGPEYPGYFPVGDDNALAELLQRCLAEPNFLSRLTSACAARAKLFLPETERETLCHILDNLLAPSQ
ncbi:MAG: TIGR04348 family glycosyltransferase [Betaproteobacteria bacterium]|nr:TIGR04348 family glycosyltransferase [Betaproteobacteria bacterium]